MTLTKNQKRALVGTGAAAAAAVGVVVVGVPVGLATAAMITALAVGTGGVGVLGAGVAAAGAGALAVGGTGTLLALSAGGVAITYKGVKGLSKYKRRLRMQKRFREEQLHAWRSGVIADSIAMNSRYPAPVPEEQKQPFLITSAGYSFGIGWDSDGEVDCDLAAVIFDRHGQQMAVVNGLSAKLTFAGGAVTHSGDDDKGGAARRAGVLPDNESILIDMERLPAEAHTIVVAVVINEKDGAEVSNAYVRGLPLGETITVEEYEKRSAEANASAAAAPASEPMALESLVDGVEGAKLSEDGETVTLELPQDVMMIMLDEKEIGMCNAYIVCKMERIDLSEEMRDEAGPASDAVAEGAAGAPVDAWAVTPIRQALEGFAVSDILPEMTEHVCANWVVADQHREAGALEVAVEPSAVPVYMTVLAFDRLNRHRAIAEAVLPPSLPADTAHGIYLPRLIKNTTDSVALECNLPLKENALCDSLALVSLEDDSTVLQLKGAFWGAREDDGANSAESVKRAQLPEASTKQYKFVGRRGGDVVMESHPITFNNYAGYALPKHAKRSQKKELKELRAEEGCLVSAADNKFLVHFDAAWNLEAANVFFVLHAGLRAGDAPVSYTFSTKQAGGDERMERAGSLVPGSHHVLGKVTRRPIGHPMPFPRNEAQCAFVHYAMELPSNAIVNDMQRIFVPEVIKALWISVIAGKELSAKDKGGTSDPYISVKYNGTKISSSPTIKKTVNPQWDWECPTGLVVDPISACPHLSLEIYDADKLSRDDKMGSVDFDLIESYLPWSGPLPVVGGTGSLFVEVDYELLDIVPHISAPVDLFDEVPNEGIERTKAQQVSKNHKRILFGRRRARELGDALENMPTTPAAERDDD